MEVLHPRAALLANVEVLALLRELDAAHLARIRIKKDDAEDVAENLRTVELETIQYLAADYQPTSQQSDRGVSQLVRDLAPFSLTKAEKLQVVNLAPTEPVELYVIVEELEDRLGDRMHDILGIVSRSLSAATPAQSASSTNASTYTETFDAYEVEQGWEHEAEDAEFDDLGEGVGVEGDLDMEDDD
ncbi:HRDC-like protein [Boletus coccyginus]|nr:HRDC-like protein [Boletus coccyginus]